MGIHQQETLSPMEMWIWRILLYFARAWYTEEGDDFWNPACDLYADGFIDIFDLDLVVGNWLSSL